MRLWCFDLVPYLPKSQLLAQWRELGSIFKKQDKHILINYIYDYPVTELWNYSYIIAKEMERRGYKVNYSKANNFFKDNGTMELEGVTVRGPINCYKKHHTREYMLICFMNLHEKYIRGQKDFTEECYKKLYDYVNNFFDLEKMFKGRDNIDKFRIYF